MANFLKFLHLAGYAVYLAGVFLARPFPLPAVFWLGQVLGFSASVVMRKRRGVAVSNLRMALGIGAPEAETLARRHFMNLGANLLSMLKLPTMSDAEIFRHVTFDIAPEIPQGSNLKGWVAVLSHMSNWELVGRLTTLFPQYRFGAIYQKLSNQYVDRHFNKSRARLGARLFDRQEGFWQAVAFLESGGVLGILSDQYAGVSGTWMPFFGRLTSTSTLAAAMAERVGVEMVPVAINTTGLARWHVAIGHPIPKGRSPEISTASINRELERQITSSPADWLWAHDRWKTPEFEFLLSGRKRRIYFPPGFAGSKLTPYRILLRSVDELPEAELTVAAVCAMKHGRPDAHVTMLAPESLAEFWKAVGDVDEVITFQPRESCLQVAGKIARAGRFEVGILLPGSRRAAVEMYLAGVSYRLGPPGRPVLNNWRNAPGMSDPAARGSERYRRIASAAGAAL